MAENERILNLDPEDINVHTMMGDVFSKKNEPAKAFEEYLKAVENLSNRGQIDKIASIHKKIAQLDRNQLDPVAQGKQSLIQLLLRADESLAENKTEEAVEALAEISKSDPEDMGVMAKLAELEEKLGRIPAAVEHYSRLGESFLKSRLLKKSHEIFKKVIALDPLNVPARSNMAQIYVKQGSENEAKKEYLNIAEQALVNKNLDAAFEYAKMAVELKSIEAHYFVGIVLFERQKWVEAKAAFDYLLRFKINHVGAMVYLGKVYDAMDQSSKAAETFQKALKIEKDNLSALEAWADYCVKKKDINEAIQTITLLMNKVMADNDFGRAVQWARTLVSVDGNLLPSKLKLAEALEKNNDPQGAADVYYNLALIHSHQNQAEDAARYIRKTLELNPTHAKALAMTPVEARPQSPSSASLAPMESQEMSEIVSKTPFVEVSKAEAFKAQLDVADQYVKDGLLDEAIDIYQQLTEANPDHAEVKEKLNSVYATYAKTGTDLTKAIINESKLEEETVNVSGNNLSHQGISDKKGFVPPRPVVPAIPAAVQKLDEAALLNLREMETRTRVEADKKAAEELQKRADAERESKIREEAERKIRADAEKKIREEVEKRIRETEEKKVREELEKKIRQEIEQKVRAEIEKEEREATENKIRENAEKKAREEEAEKRSHEAAERKIRDDLEVKAREEAQKKSLDEIQRKIREAIEKKTREAAEKKAREAAENHEKLETEQKVREEVERKVREEMERKKREEAEKKIRESVERQVREESEKSVREEVERRTREELEKQFRDDDKKKAREEAKKKIQEVMNKKTGELSEMVALGEADTLYDRGRYEEALRMYEKILESNPGHPRVLIKLSVVREVLKSKEALVANYGNPPVLKLVEPTAKSNSTVPPDSGKDSDGKKTSSKIGYV
jgi:tetratricopeptide (TPR) repeat protein